MDVEANKNEVVNASADRAPATSVDTLRLEGATVLAVWAHPDDESYLGGGLMAAAAAAGGRVVNVTATLGEHGTPDPVTMPPGRLARIRQHELDHALQALGVSESITLGYEDGTLDTIDTIDTKLAALSAHGSQTELFRAHLGDADYRRLAAVEAYFPANARAFDLLGASMAATAA